MNFPTLTSVDNDRFVIDFPESSMDAFGAVERARAFAQIGGAFL